MGTQRFRKDRFLFLAVFLFSAVLYGLVWWLNPYLYHVFHMDDFLTIHICLELLSIVMSFCIFLIAYYTFERCRRLRTLIFSCTFLAVGLLDLFHTLGYNGMPRFLTPPSVSKATSFWIAARLTSCIGMLIAGLVRDKTTRVSRRLCAAASLVYSGILLYLLTYRLDRVPPLFIEGQGLTPLKIHLEYLIIAVFLISLGLFYRIYRWEKGEEGYRYVILSILLSIFSELAFTQYYNVYDSYNLLGHIYKIVAYYFLFKAKFVLNVQKPYRALHKTEQKLSQYADGLEDQVEQRTKEITAANEKLIKDLNDARHIQSALLPVSFPMAERLEFYASYMPCEKIGGDFYNVYRLDDENVGVLIGDVAGHGVSAAMITVFINQNIHVRREYDDGRIRVLSPKQVLNNLYYTYNRMPFPEETYTVLFYGIYHLKSRVLTYCSAGMNVSPLVLEKSGEVRPVPIVGLPICKLAEIVSPSYENRRLQLEEGDSLLLFTDGLIEIDRKKPDQFDEPNLMEFLKGMKNKTAEETAGYLLDLYQAILGGNQMIDDVTVLVMKIRESDGKEVKSL